MHGTFFHDEHGGFRIFRAFWVAIGGVILATLLALALGWLLQYLWNTIPAALFKWPTITYWQAVGLFILSKLLFGGMGGHPHHPGHHGHGRKFRKWHRHCGGNWETESGHERFHHFWDEEGREAFEAYLGKKKAE
jgi:hypothetical protein